MQWPAVSTRSRAIAVPVQDVPCEPTIITAWRPPTSADGALPVIAKAGAGSTKQARAMRTWRMNADEPRRAATVNLSLILRGAVERGKPSLSSPGLSGDPA